MADGQQGQRGGQQQQFSGNDYYLKEQAARMLSAIHNKRYNEGFETTQVTMPNSQANQQVVSAYMNHQVGNGPLSQQPQQHSAQQQGQTSSHNVQVQHQQLQHQLQQVQQAQQQFQQMQQLAQMQQQFQQQFGDDGATSSGMGSPTSLAHCHTTFVPVRRGRKPSDKRKRKRHTSVKRPTTAYLYFVSKYRETLKEAGEVVPKAKIITQACAEKWRHMTEEEKEPFLELARRDRERWQVDKALEKRPRDPNRPKRPMSAYFFFLKEFRNKYPNKTDPAKEITKQAGEKWNSLSEEEKIPFYKLAQVERAKWEIAMEEYKQSQRLNAVAPGGTDRALAMNQCQQQQAATSSAVSSPSPGNNASMPGLMVPQTSMLSDGGTMTQVTTPEPQSLTAPPQPQQATTQPVYAYPGQHMMTGSQPTNLQQFHTAR